MKAFSDEEIQKMLEHKKHAVKEAFSPGQQKEVDAYEFLFQELKKEPAAGLSYGFSAKIVSKIEAKKSFRNDAKVYIFATVILILSVIGAYFLSLYIGHAFNFQIISPIWPYRWILIFISIILVLVQYFDQKLIRKFKTTDQI